MDFANRPNHEHFHCLLQLNNDTRGRDPTRQLLAGSAAFTAAYGRARPWGGRTRSLTSCIATHAQLHAASTPGCHVHAGHASVLVDTAVWSCMHVAVHGADAWPWGTAAWLVTFHSFSCESIPDAAWNGRMEWHPSGTMVNCDARSSAGMHGTSHPLPSQSSTLVCNPCLP